MATAGLTLLARGEYAPAVDHILAGLKLSDLQPSQEPGNTFGGMDLVEGLLCAGVNEALRKVHPGGEFPLEAAQAIVDQLGEGPDREVFAKQVAEQARIHVRYLSFYPWNQFKEGWFSGMFFTAYANAASPIIDRDVRLYTDAITRFMDLAPLPYYEAAPQLAEIRLLPSTWRPDRSGMMWGFEAIREDGFPNQAWREVRLDLARMGLLLARHHMEHGAYPPSLDAIAKKLDGGIPIDPFSGKPYRYVLNDEGCLLYSVGRNQIDDGGVPGRAAGDILWRQRWALPEPVEEDDAWARRLLDLLR